MTRVKMICAENHTQAAKSARAMGLSRRSWRYASSAAAVDGSQNFDVLVYPSFVNHPRRDDVWATLRRNDAKQPHPIGLPEDVPLGGATAWSAMPEDEDHAALVGTVTS